MTLYVSNRDGNGKTDEMGHYRIPSILTTGTALFPGLAVTQNSPLGMSVLVAAGDYRIDTGNGYAYMGWNNVSTPVTLSVADAANPRIDSIVVYVDKGAATSASPPNNPGIAKLIKVNGTPNSSPTAPNSGTIQTAVGAGNPYIILANVYVGANVTQILNANITDMRTRLGIANDVVLTNSLLDGAVTTPKLGDGAVTSAKILDGSIATVDYGNLSITSPKLADAAVTTAKFKPSIINSNFTPAGGRWNQTATGVWQTVTNCSMNYTSGPTPERLFLTMSLMASKTAGNGEGTLAINGVRQQQMYFDATWSWARTGMDYVYDVPANTTISLAVQTANLSGAGSMFVCNEVAQWMPKVTGFSIYNGP